MWELAEFKGVSLIKLSDGSSVQTYKSPDEVLKIINSGVKFVKIWGKVVNINAIWTIDVKEASDIDIFLMGITDDIMRDRMEGILEERKNKWLKTSGISHLVDIYESRYWKIWEQKE